MGGLIVVTTEPNVTLPLRPQVGFPLPAKFGMKFDTHNEGRKNLTEKISKVLTMIIDYFWLSLSLRLMTINEFQLTTCKTLP